MDGALNSAIRVGVLIPEFADGDQRRVNRLFRSRHTGEDARVWRIRATHPPYGGILTTR